MILDKAEMPLKEASLLVGEGQADAYFFDALTKNRGIVGFDFAWPQPINDDTGGVSKYPTFLKGLVARSGYERLTTLVLTADNDDFATATNFADLRKWIGESGFPVPSEPMKFAVSGARKVAIIMLPSTGQDGCLETLLLKSLKWTPAQVACVEEYCKCTEIGKWSRSAQDKARLACIFAAAFKKPRTLAYVWGKQENPLDVSQTCFTDIADFLRTCV